ncbi:MAG: hypothetical protein HYZ37_05425 [Candidatus Solibacter usitatus]|nr:hypothetical protein [Candidatus Solibacter usitatus]
MRRLIFFIAWWALAATASQAQQAKQALFADIDEILKDLAQITGLPATRKVASDTIDRAGLKKFLEDRIKEAVKPEEIRAEEVTLKKLGLVPSTFDLKKTTIDLLTEQAAAFYDYHKKKLFLLESNSSFTERPVLVHELSHALADMHFNLSKYIGKSRSDDASVARQAVMEGQATWLMTEYMLFKVGTSLTKAAGMADSMNRMAGAGGGGFPVFDAAPLYLRESLVFPYTKGFSFQHAVILKMGQQGFGEVFRNPPLSAQQILHPEKYFSKTIPTKLEPPKVKLRGYRELVAGGVGEFDHQMLLRTHTSEEESKAAEKWRGASYRILENKKDKNLTVLCYASEWQDETSARKFFELYQTVLRKKWNQFEISRRTESEVDGNGDDGRFQLRRSGNIVTSLEGLPK